MELRTLIGPQAGQILDFSTAAAKAMLADGRAILPDAPYPPICTEEVSTPVALAHFAEGGVVPATPTAFVGEAPAGSFVPTNVASRLVATAAGAVSRRGRRG